MHKKTRERYWAQLRLLGVDAYIKYHRSKHCKQWYNCVLLSQWHYRDRDKWPEMYNEFINRAQSYVEDIPDEKIEQWADNIDVIDQIFRSPAWIWGIENHICDGTVMTVYQFKQRRKAGEFQTEDT